MKGLKIIGLIAALLVHGLILLFGGVFLPHKEKKPAIQQIDLVSEDLDKPKEDEKKEEPEEKPEEAAPAQEAPPDASEVVSNLEQPPASDPGLSAASLSDIEAALNGAGGDDSFGGSMSFASGGRIGGKGPPGARAEADGGESEEAFAAGDLDQKPRVLFQTPPAYPAELRGKKIEGVVQLLFIVDAQGRVVDPKVEKTSHPAFAKPAIEAVRKWKFEPASRGGQKVGSRMKVPIRFQSA